MGGAGEHWNGITPRFLPDCFEIHTRTVERYGAARLPANHSIQDWGITYAELEPFYTRAEWLLGISGKTGLDPFEGPHSAEYPTPPQKMAYFPALFSDAARSLGYHPFPSAFGQPESGLSQSGRHCAAGLPVLRLLRAFWVHGGRQSAAHEHPAAGDRAAERRDRAHRSECPARASPGRQGDWLIVCRLQWRRSCSAGRPGGAGLVDTQQHTASAAIEDRRSVRRAERQRPGRAQPHPPGAVPTEWCCSSTVR